MTPTRVVIVEDEGIVALHLKQKLHSSGYAVAATAPTGELALQAIAEHRPDIVLMDIHIQGPIDGIETAMRIPPELGAPVIFLTAFSEEATLARARAAKPYGYLIKPFSDRELHAAIQVALERRALLDELDRRREEADQSAQRLAEREQFFRAITDSVHEIIVRHDVSGLINYISPSVDQLGFTPAEVIGRNAMEFYHPDELETLKAGFSQVLAGLEPQPVYNREHRLRCKDGRWIWVTSNPSYIRDENGAVTGLVSVLHDVTLRREMEDELVRKREEAEAGLRAKADFLANMSHELRTPLTGVLGYAGLLDQVAGLPDEARRHVDRIQASGRALLAIVNDILDFSRLESAQVELDPQPFDPLALAVETLDSLRPLAQQKGLAVRIAPSSRLPPVLVADGARIRQVLLNLVGNAVKFTETGGVTIDVDYSAETERLRLAVRDTGVGIPPEALERLFVRFSQVDGAASRRFSGAGLGLAISKGLVEMMGGTIGVESAPGAGSTFWFDVAAPIGRAEPRSDAEADADGDAATAFPALRILLVDDLEVNRDLVSAMLAQFDVAVTEASSGAEAIAASMRERFDLVLMDLQMPVMGGLEATRRIRALGGPQGRVPIVAMTANAMEEDVEATRAAGMDEHIAKPIDARAFLAVVARMTAQAAAEEPTYPAVAAG